jgi:hypothetical protein
MQRRDSMRRCAANISAPYSTTGWQSKSVHVEVLAFPQIVAERLGVTVLSPGE